MVSYFKIVNTIPWRSEAWALTKRIKEIVLIFERKILYRVYEPTRKMEPLRHSKEV